MWLIPPSICSAFVPVQACSMKEFASQFPERGLHASSSGKATLRPFSWRGWQTRPWSQHLFGAATLKNLAGESGVVPWIASLRDSLASRGVPQESSKGRTTTDGYGQQSSTSSETSPHPSYLLKMSQGSLLDADSIAYSETLPGSGSMRSGVLYPQPTWEPPISASESSYWPSTRAEDAESCGNHPNGASDSLTGVTRNWPTPTEDNANNCGGPSRSREGGYADLTVIVNQWPSMRTTGLDGGSNSRKAAKSRGAWPTTGANDHKGSAKEGQRRGQLDEATEQIFSHPGPAIADGPPSSPLPHWLAPALEPGVRGLAHGNPMVVDEHRADQLRAIGNGVVPLCAGVAFAVLARRLIG